MFQEPIRFIEDMIQQRSLGARPDLRQLHVRESGAGEALRHAGVEGDNDTGCASMMPAIISAAACSPWPFPHAELAGPAHQPGEARLLGGAPRARRNDSAASAGGSRTAAATNPRSICRCATCSPSIAPTRSAPPAMRVRFVRPGVRRLRAGRRCPHQRPGRASGGYLTRLSPAAAKVRDVEGMRTYIREHRQQELLDNLEPQTAGLRAEPLAAALRRSPHRPHEFQLAANGYRFDTLVETIVPARSF